MFDFLRSENKEAPEVKSSQVVDQIKENRYYDYCIKKCFKNYTKYLIEEEKVCLAQCSDNISVILKKQAELIVKAKSYVN